MCASPPDRSGVFAVWRDLASSGEDRFSAAPAARGTRSALHPREMNEFDSNFTSTPSTEATSTRAFDADEVARVLRIIRTTARSLAHHTGHRVEVEDLESAGWVGALDAASRRGDGMAPDQAEAQLRLRIRGAMLDHLRALDPATRGVRRLARELARAVESLTRTLKRAPDQEEVAAAMGLSLSEFHEVRARINGHSPASLEEDLGRSGVAGESDAEERAAEGELLALLEKAIDALPARLRAVVSLRHVDACSLREVGEVLGVTESRACQLHKEAMARLRRSLEEVRGEGGEAGGPPLNPLLESGSHQRRSSSVKVVAQRGGRER